MPKLVHKTGEHPPVVLDHEPLTVGRRPDNRLHLAQSFISSTHAVLRYADDFWWVEDLGSSNGTFVNEQRVPAKGRQVLRHGDEIRFAKLVFQFQYEEMALDAATVILSAPVPLPTAPPPTPAVASSIPSSVPSVAPSMTPTAMPPAQTPTGTATPAIPRPTAPTDVNMLDELVGSIRSHRERERREREAQQAALREQWEKILSYAEALQRKVRGDKRIRYFAVSRRNNEIMIRFQRDSKSTAQFLLLSLQHPDQPNHVLTGIWMRRSGEPDRCFEIAESAARELVQEMAFLLA